MRVVGKYNLGQIMLVFLFFCHLIIDLEDCIENSVEVFIIATYEQ